jgi:hypothetical protein
MPSIAPSSPDDVDVYLVLDDFDERLGRAWRETDEERTRMPKFEFCPRPAKPCPLALSGSRESQRPDAIRA